MVIEPAESGLPKPSAVLLHHIRSMDRQRLVKRMGRLSRASLARVHAAIKINLGLVEF